ncbi:hypothetical protein GDO86_015034 [Hymenochirus boettgeri]|nr:hypothetical protein GDO86_015034 [Hymenochirus boettgeri]
MSLPGDTEECMAPAAKRRILDTEAVGKENGSQDLQVSQEAEAAQTLFEMTNWRETGDQHPKEGTSEGHEGNTMPHTPEKGVTKDHNNVRQPRRSSERRDTRVNPRGTMPKCPKELKTGENHSKLSQHRKTDIAISKDQNLERGDSDEEPSALSPLSSDSDHHSHSEGDECCIVSVGTQPSNTERSLKALESVQQELKAVNERADRAFLQLKRRYGHLRRPHIQKRSAIISTIPGFWVTAFLSHPQMSAMIDDRDEDTLSYMNNLQVEDFTHMKSSCKIEFYFNRNPYFKNEVLIKEFQYNSSGRLVSRSTPIRWLQGQKPRGEDKSSPSFFSWFSDHSFPSADRIAT